MHSETVGASAAFSFLSAWSIGSLSNLALSIDSYFLELYPAIFSYDTSLVILSAVVDTVLLGLELSPSFDLFGGS